MTVACLNKPLTRPKAAELQERMHQLISEYDGEIGFLEALGAIEFVKLVVMERQLENINAD